MAMIKNMTQEDKDLLLRDLCCRLPYGVIVEDRNGVHPLTTGNTEFTALFGGSGWHIIKPYLRPMSSMTEEERKEYKHLVAFSGNSYGAADLVDWLNKKMFAYRTIDGKDMFELGLALEATEGMYK